ncbi:hypothetical protein [Spirillospora albida]|uniref:hypothetical protein n=1 Tax=Spirillospora albida TaxID=58123 RepID=UPI0004BEA02E|nr:hypothetical protein [Spirillospora albida]
MPTHYQALAVLSTGIYFAGLAHFKMAAAGMPVLRGHRPLRLAGSLLRSPRWLTGAAVLAVGATVQVAALTGLTVAEAQPLFLAGVAMLLVLSLAAMGERLTLREWGCVLLLAAAAVIFSHAALTRSPDGPPAAAPSTLLVVAVALPSLLVPCLGFLAGDLTRKGAHSRPLTGVALAVNVGVLTGTAELMLKGAADHATSLGALAGTPYPYLFAVTAPLALGVLQIALQRGRLAIVGLVATASAKTYLLIVATLLYREPWPSAGDRTTVALALSILAIAAVPHHEPAPRTPTGHLEREVIRS